MNSPSHSPLNQNVLQLFKNSLWELRRDLQLAVEKAEAEIRAFGDAGPLDDVDASWANSAKEAMFARYSQARTQLRKLGIALERVKSGDFGICVNCEGPISLKRLQALPWAVNCIDCERQSEQCRPLGEAGMHPSYAG